MKQTKIDSAEGVEATTPVSQEATEAAEVAAPVNQEATEAVESTAPANQQAGTAEVAAPVNQGASRHAKKAAALFEEYPQVREFHFADDGLAFFEKGDALNHASGLDYKGVVTIQKQG